MICMLNVQSRLNEHVVRKMQYVTGGPTRSIKGVDTGRTLNPPGEFK